MKRNKKKSQQARMRLALKSGNTEDARVNECGDCDFCCKAPAINEFDMTPEESELLGGSKPSCVTCKHASNGCAIYDKRPEICRGYMCLYSIGQVELRPDKSRVAWTLQPTEGCERPVLMMGHCFDIDEVLTIEENLSVIDAALHNDMTEFVVLRTDKEAWCFMRDGIVHKIKIDQTDKMKMRVLPHTEKTARFQMIEDENEIR